MKSPDAQQCPDAASILSAAHALFPQRELTVAVAPDRAALNIEVVIRRTPEGYEGVLSARGAYGGQRRIVDPDEGCQGLAHALAVALVMLIEPSSEPPAMRSSQVPQLVWPVAPEVPQQRRLAQVGFEAGALAADGLLGGASGNPGAFGAYVGLAYSRISGPGIRVRGMDLQSLPTQYAPGNVRVNLMAATMSLCWRLGNRDRWTVDPCWDLGLGRQRGEGSGYSRANAQWRWWSTTGPSLTSSFALIGVLNATFTAAMGARLYEQTFSVNDAAGSSHVVQEQKLVGEYLGLGLTAIWPPVVELTGR